MQERLVMALFNGLILVTILITQLFTARISKNNRLLGVRIPEDKIESDEVKNIAKGFKRENLIIGIPVLIVTCLIIYFIDSIRFFVISIFIYIGVLFLIYLRWHGKTNKLRKENKWDKNRKKKESIEQNPNKDDEKSKSISHRWFLIPLSIILLNIVVGLAIYPILPDKLPIYWDLQGNAEAYVDKSIIGVLLVPIMQLFLAVVIYLSYFSMKKAKQHANPRDPKRSLKKNIIFRKVWSVYFIIILSLVEILLTVLNMMTLGLITNMKLFNVFSFAITGIIIVGAIILAIIMGQGGDRLRIEDEEVSLKYKYMDDKFWKLGNRIYFNPENPTIFIDKRVGIGWTVNLGRPSGVIIMVFPIIIVIFALVFAG